MKTTEIFKTWLNMNEGTGLNLFDYFEGEHLNILQKALVLVLNIIALCCIPVFILIAAIAVLCVIIKDKIETLI